MPLLELARLGSPDLGAPAVGIVAAIVALGVHERLSRRFRQARSIPRPQPRPAALVRERGRIGGVARRALALTGVVVLGYFALMVASGLDLTPFILVHTSSMVAIYALGMVAAVRLLDRFTVGWWLAVIAALLCGGMLVLALGSLLPAAVLAVAALVVTVVRRTRDRAAERRGPRPDIRTRPAAADTLARGSAPSS